MFLTLCPNYLCGLYKPASVSVISFLELSLYFYLKLCGKLDSIVCLSALWES